MASDDINWVSCEAAEGYSASHWPLNLQIRQDIIELVLQAWGCFPWDIAAQEAATKSADF